MQATPPQPAKYKYGNNKPDISFPWDFAYLTCYLIALPPSA